MSPTRRAVRFFSWASSGLTRAAEPSPTKITPGPADHAVHGVEVPGRGDARGDPPLAAQVVQRPRRRAGLALGLAVDRLLRAPAEDDERDQRAEHDAERDQRHHREGAAAEHPSGHRRGDDQHERADHVRQKPLVFLALHLERLPQLAAALLGRRLAGGLRLGLGGLRWRRDCEFSPFGQDTGGGQLSRTGWS